MKYLVSVHHYWVEGITPFGADKYYLSRDTSEVFFEICESADSYLAFHKIKASDSQVIGMFRVVVFSWVIEGHYNQWFIPFVRRSIEIDASLPPEEPHSSNLVRLEAAG